MAALLLLLTAISYPLDARSVDWLGRIAFLDGPLAQGFGVTVSVLAGVCIVWGEVSLGRSFRVALPESKQPLVTLTASTALCATRWRCRWTCWSGEILGS